VSTTGPGAVIGLPGGGFGFGYGSMNRMGQGRSPVAPLNRPIGRSPINSYIPVARISDLLLHPGTTIDYNGQRITFPEISLAGRARVSQVVVDAIGHTAIGRTRLVRVFDLQVAVVGRQCVQGAAASFLGLVLQFSDLTQTEH